MHTYTSEWLVDGKAVPVSDWLANEIKYVHTSNSIIMPLRPGGVNGVTDEFMRWETGSRILTAGCRVALRYEDGELGPRLYAPIRVSMDGEYRLEDRGYAELSDREWDAAYEALERAIKCTNFYAGFGVHGEEIARAAKRAACKDCRYQPWRWVCRCPDTDTE